jgi:hypothetical protein
VYLPVATQVCQILTPSSPSHFVMKPIYISIVHLRSQTTEEPNKQRLSLLSDYTLQYSHLHTICTAWILTGTQMHANRLRVRRMSYEAAFEMCFLARTTPLLSGVLLPACCTLLSKQPPTCIVPQRVHRMNAFVLYLAVMYAGAAVIMPQGLLCRRSQVRSIVLIAKH